MNNNSSIQQFTSSPERKAIISLVIGGINTIFSLLLVFYFLNEYRYNLPSEFIMSGGTIVVFLISIVGLVFGEKGLKSTKKALSIIGICLSTLTLIVGSTFLVFSFFFYESSVLNKILRSLSVWSLGDEYAFYLMLPVFLIMVSIISLALGIARIVFRESLAKTIILLVIPLSIIISFIILYMMLASMW